MRKRKPNHAPRNTKHETRHSSLIIALHVLHYVKILCILLIAIFVLSCGRGDDVKIVTIVTQDANGNKIPNVNLIITKDNIVKQIQTDENGEYNVSADIKKLLTAGTKISPKEGYRDIEKSITNEDRKQEILVIELFRESDVVEPPKGKVEISCVNVKGKPLSSVSIKIVGKQIGTTNEDGICIINSVASETAISIGKDGYQSESISLRPDDRSKKVTLRRLLILSVRGEEVDQNGKVVGDVNNFTVSLTDYRGKTIKKGKISKSEGRITFPEPTGDNVVEVRTEKAGYGSDKKTITITNETQYELTFRLTRAPEQYRLEVNLKYEGRFVEDARIQLKDVNGIEIESKTTSASEPVVFQFRREINSTVSVTGTHSYYKIPKEMLVLMNNKNPKVTLKLETVSLNINCVTSDQNRDIHDAVVVAIQTVDGEEVEHTNMSLNSRKTVTIPQLVSDQIYIVAQTGRESNYGQDEPLLHQLKPEKNDVELVLNSNLREIQITIRCEDENGVPIEGVALTANKASFQKLTNSNGTAVYGGKSRPDRPITIEGQKPMYKFESKKIMIGDTRNYTETLIGSRSLVSLHFRCRSEDGKMITNFKVFINNEPHLATNDRYTHDIKVDPGDIVTLKAEREGYEFLKWDAPVQREQLTITKQLEYNLTAILRRLPTISITLLEAKMPHKPIPNASVEISGKGAFGKTDTNGKLSRLLPSIGSFTFKFSKENYLSLKDLEIAVGPERSKYSSERYLLNITSPKQRISLITPIKYDVAYDSILDDQDQKDRIQNRIREAISKDFFSQDYFTDAQDITVRDLDDQDELIKAMSSKSLDYAVGALISQDGDLYQLQVNIYEKDGNICASALVNNVLLNNIQSDIANQIIPELSRTLPIEGYVLGTERTRARLNIGNEQFIQVGDTFEVEKIVIDNSNGKFIDYEKLSGEYKVVSVDGRTESYIEGASVSSLTRGSHVKRKATAGGTRNASYTIIDKFTGSPITNNLYCYVKTQDNPSWTFPSQSIDFGKLVVDIPRESCELKIVVSKYKEIPTKTYSRGSQDIQETIRVEPAMYTLSVKTTPNRCNVSIASGTGKNTEKITIKPGTQIGPGSYTLTVSPPRDKIDEYETAKISGVIPLPKGVSEWGKGGKAKFDLQGSNITLTVRLAPNWSSVIKKLEAGNLSPEEFVRRARDAKPTDEKYRDVVFKAGSILLDELDRPEDAAEEFRKALVVDPQDPSAYFNVGLCLSQMSKYNEAIQNLKEAQKFQDRLASASHRLRLVHDIRYEIVLANDKLNEPIDTISACNDYKDFYYNLKKKYERIGALKYYENNRKYFDRCNERVGMILSEAEKR